MGILHPPSEKALRFRRWELSDGLSLSAVVGPGFSGCGIYVLEFADGTEYVGQTVNLLSRFTSHRRRWPNEIVAARFAPAPQDLLNQYERDVVARSVAAGARLRNVDLVTLPLGPAALDLVVDRAVRDEWLRGDTESVNIGERGAVAAQRRQTLAKYRALEARPDFPALADALSAYIRFCLPWPHQTEARFWVLTSLPGSGRSSTWHRLAAISVNNVETLVLGEARNDPGDPWEFAGFMNVDIDTPLLDALRPVAGQGGTRPSVR